MEERMSLRDFNTGNEPLQKDALHNDPLGNGSGLENFHTVNPEDREPSSLPKIVGAVAVALMVGTAGVALYAYSGNTASKPIVSASNAPVVPPQSAPAAQPVQQDAMTAPADANTPASTPASTPADTTQSAP